MEHSSDLFVLDCMFVHWLSPGTCNGAALTCRRIIAKVKNSTFVLCQASASVGALFLFGGGITILSSGFFRNTAQVWAGAIFNDQINKTQFDKSIRLATSRRVIVF
jgi:hypothetical protein